MSELDRLDRLQEIAERRLPPPPEPEFVPSFSALPNNFIALPPGVKRNEFGKFYCENCLTVLTTIHLQGDARPAIVPHACSWMCGLCSSKFADKKEYQWHIIHCAKYYDKHKLSGWI